MTTSRLPIRRRSTSALARRLLAWQRTPRTTSDRFAIVLEATDKVYSETDAKALLEETGCRDIRPLVELEEEDGAII